MTEEEKQKAIRELAAGYLMATGKLSFSWYIEEAYKRATQTIEAVLNYENQRQSGERH